jgi:predicted ester cyclase
MTLAPHSYAEDFADHVGNLEYRGLDGVRRSTALYRALFDDLAFNVLDQVAEGDRVASRFVVSGSNRGRRVRLWGITISRLQDGRIVEDYSAFDSLELLKQLGLRERCWRRRGCSPRLGEHRGVTSKARRGDRDVRRAPTALLKLPAACQSAPSSPQYRSMLIRPTVSTSVAWLLSGLNCFDKHGQ